MNILYIDHYAGSITMGMEFRPYYLAKEWNKLGHKVRIIGADFSHLRKINPCVKHDFEIQEIDGVEYQWIKTRTYEGNGISRAITMFQFCWKLWLHAKKITKEFCPDVIITSSTYPLDTFPGQRMKKMSNAQLVHEIHDMWPITPIELYGMSPKNPFVIAMQIGENSFCKNSDKVVSILPNSDSYLERHGMKKEKFFFVPNGINLADWDVFASLPEEHTNVLNRAQRENRFVISFFGSHTKSYSLDYLLEALAQCNQAKIFVCFVGSGNYKEELQIKAKELSLDQNCYAFLPQIDKKAIPSLIQASDASYVGAIRNKMFRFGIGMNKLFDAMMGGKPIIYAVEAPNNMIEEFSCGITVPAEDSKALAKGIEDLLSMERDVLLKFGENGRKAVLENFTYEVIAKKFLKILES